MDIRNSSYRRGADFVVGLFVIFAFAGLLFIALRAADITHMSSASSYVVRVRFDNIGSLADLSPVKSSGVRVGQVKSIAYDTQEYMALVEIIIDSRYQFPSDSIFSIVSSNLLGGQYISIEVGAEEGMIDHNALVEGNSAIVLENLISKFLFDKAASGD